MALINKLRAIGDAIRAKTGKTDELTLDQMVTEIEGIEGGSGGWDGHLTNKNSEPLSIGDFFFKGNNELKTINISPNNKNYVNDITIGKYACAFASSLEEVKIDPQAGCRVDIKDCAFQGCNKLHTVDLSDVSHIRKDAFNGCNSLVSLVINDTNNMVSLVIAEGAFAECPIQNIPNLPVEKLGADAFAGCEKLEYVTLSGCTSIGDNCFARCRKLRAIRLSGADVCNIALTSFMDTQIADETGLPTGAGYIYVDSMYDYRVAYEPVFEGLGFSGLFDLLFKSADEWPY